MKIVSVKIKNFRGYRDEVTIRFDDLTALIGKNDAGKSTILEMLDIFFNDKKIDKNDVNKECRANNDLETVFTIRFSNLPLEVNIDAGNPTTLQAEFLTIEQDQIEIVKKYKDGGKPKIFLRAMHPTNCKCCDLLKKKHAELKTLVETLGLDCDRSKNAVMRHAIWAHYEEDLQLAECELDVDSKDGEVKAIWEKIQKYLPMYALFKSDRSNLEKDAEIQDPLKFAVKEFMRKEEIAAKLNEINLLVKECVEDVAVRTLAKLQEMNAKVAASLNPLLSDPKWEDVFKGISITGDDDIPLDKRGSGVRRLILLNFFRAEAERKQNEHGAPDIIYAIEEPETSQHADFQYILIESFKKLAKLPTVQVLLTTHSSHIVKALSNENSRVVKHESGSASVHSVDDRRVLLCFSLNEASYLAFGGDMATEYHNELYGYLQSRACEDDIGCEFENNFEKWLVMHGVSKTEQWIRIKNGQQKPAYLVTLPTYVRNWIHHPENSENAPIDLPRIKESIGIMRMVAERLS